MTKILQVARRGDGQPRLIVVAWWRSGRSRLGATTHWDRASALLAGEGASGFGAPSPAWAARRLRHEERLTS